MGSPDRVEFGEDVHTHSCGTEFVLEANAGFKGKQFGPDGFAYDELDQVWCDAWVCCEKCKVRYDFGDYQEAAVDHVSSE